MAVGALIPQGLLIEHVSEGLRSEHKGGPIIGVHRPWSRNGLDRHAGGDGLSFTS